MIKSNTSLSMAESLEYIKDKNLAGFIKNFNPLSHQKAKELRKKIQGLNLIKLNEKHISKLIDLLPEDKESLNKVLVDVNLDENETNSTLQTIKEFK